MNRWLKRWYHFLLKTFILIFFILNLLKFCTKEKWPWKLIWSVDGGPLRAESAQPQLFGSRRWWTERSWREGNGLGLQERLSEGPRETRVTNSSPFKAAYRFSPWTGSWGGMWASTVIPSWSANGSHWSWSLIL